MLSVVNSSCTGCHTPASGPLGDLDLTTDPYAALVGAASQYPGRTLVVAGDPAASFLMAKLEGTQAAAEGTVMPPNGALGAAELDLVRAWIQDGAADVCDDPTTGTGDGYHPVGWVAEDVHGLAAKLQEDTCVACHGSDLEGGVVGVSCDTCHPAGWRTECTFCHGGELTPGRRAAARHRRKLGPVHDQLLAARRPRHHRHPRGVRLRDVPPEAVRRAQRRALVPR